MCPGRFFGVPPYYGLQDDTDTKAFPLIVRINQVLLQFLFKKFFFLTHPCFQTFVIVKSKLTPDHNIVNFSTRFTRLGLVLRWIHNTLTMLWCSFIVNKTTNDKETSVNVMNWTIKSLFNLLFPYFIVCSRDHSYICGRRSRQLKRPCA